MSAECEPSYIGRLERGKENPTVDLLEAIAAVLGEPIVNALFHPKLPEGEALPLGLPPGRKPAVPRLGPLTAAPLLGFNHRAERKADHRLQLDRARC